MILQKELSLTDSTTIMTHLDYVSFLLLLVATGSLLYHYGKSIKKSKLILILALPLLELHLFFSRYTEYL